MALFFAAAQRKLLPKRKPTTEAELAVGQEGERVFVALVPPLPAPFPKTAELRGSTLSEAFLTLWQHYSNDERQASICARVLGFYLLTERTEGAVLRPWAVPNPTDPETVLLHPALIEGLAAVPLLADGQLPEDLFLEIVASLAFSSSSSTPIADASE